MKRFRQDWKMIRRGIGQIRQIQPHFLLLQCIFPIFNAAVPFVNLYLSARLLDELSAGAALSRLLLFASLIVLCNFLISVIQRLIEAKMNSKTFAFSKTYEMSLTNKLADMDYAQIEDSETHLLLERIQAGQNLHNYGLLKIVEILPRFSLYFYQIMFALFMVVPVFSSTSAVTGTGFLRFFASPTASLLLVLLLVICAALSMFSTSRLSLKIKEVMGGFVFLNRAFHYYEHEYLDGYRAGKDVRLYKQNQLIIRELDLLSAQAVQNVKNRTRAECFYESMKLFAEVLLNLFVYLFIIMRSVGGAFGVGSIVKYIGVVMELNQSCSEFMHCITILRANNDYLQHYLAFMDIKSSMKTGCKKVDLYEPIEIEFKNVSFQYPHSKRPVLENVNLTIKNGEHLAIVGENGSGKTTLIKLLCRLYDPTRGQILLNGVNIREYDYASYKELFSAVFQDLKLFSFTLGQNIAAGTSYDQDKVVNCLKKVGFEEKLLSMNQGTETYMYRDFDENGVEISGGEAQKIALARALYKNAPVAVLDEPTAALDPMAEEEIYRLFNQNVKDKSVIFISHRLSSCRFCDQIAVFDAGRLVQCGRHEQLLREEKGKYYHLWNAQAQYYAADEPLKQTETPLQAE